MATGSTNASTSDGAPVHRRRRAKGRRPFFFEDKNVDRQLAIVAALSGEVSVIRQRLAAHESLAAAGIPATEDAVESFEPSEQEKEALADWRREFLTRVFRILEFQTDVEAAESAEAEYNAMVGNFANDIGGNDESNS